MKRTFTILTLIVITIVVAFIFSDQTRESELPADLTRALTLMESIESRSLTEPITDGELAELRHLYALVEKRVPIITEDARYYKQQVIDELDDLFPTNNNIEDAGNVVGRTVAFVTSLEDTNKNGNIVPGYRTIVGAEIANILDVPTTDIHNSTTLLDNAYQSTVGFRYGRSANRFFNWFTNFEKDLCTTTDPQHDIYTPGTTTKQYDPDFTTTQ